MLTNGIYAIKQKYPGLNCVILSDSYTVQPPVIESVIDCSKECTDSLMQYDFSQTIFIYACEQDYIGLPFVDLIIEHKGVFEPVWCAEPSTYVNTNHVARDVLEKEFIYQTANGYAKWDFGYGDFANITQVIEVTRAVKGDFVEIGCYNGSSSSGDAISL